MKGHGFFPLHPSGFFSGIQVIEVKNEIFSPKVSVELISQCEFDTTSFSFFSFFLYRRSSAFISWSYTHILFLDHWGIFCAGGHPNVHFRCCHCRDSNPDRVNANNKYCRLYDVSHSDPLNIQLTHQLKQRHSRLSCSQSSSHQILLSFATPQKYKTAAAISL